MEINCPSCSAKHRSEDYPNAFDIQCSCGYLILVPDEEALSAPQDSLDRFSPAYEPADGSASVPTSMEEEDSQLKISASELLSPSQMIENSPGSNEMTPPDQLPEEMVYDPFELPTIPQPLMGQESAENIAKQSTDFVTEAVESLQNVVAEVESEIIRNREEESPLNLPEQSRNSTPNIRYEPDELLKRSHLANLGQFVGPDYDLEIQDLGSDEIVKMSELCQRFLDERPWLKEEIEKRKIDFSEFEKTSKLKSVPEILAVEIFLKSYESGGKCRFRRS